MTNEQELHQYPDGSPRHWEDGTPRSWGRGFTHGILGQPVRYRRGDGEPAPSPAPRNLRADNAFGVKDGRIPDMGNEPVQRKQRTPGRYAPKAVV